ncbi:hypothetical protein COA17_06535 [Sphingomonas ginsenosidimutans]|uniref:SnoaL-like domain-containing protein n=1 Tax=Sphingomonas ginsenosidimutans TaxID=862134 RepID=A0A2A4HYV4_9SPHN|nr:nuclear transport factor 2 family protein [Sphingomonas ginsenosidimutans]PCG09524.1 hypothetical protein COA17_06535 [Sphingomonas ginsenosidimutans]
MARSAVDIVRAYGVQAWTEGRDDWIPELCADPIIRHDANREVRLSHAEQRARMRHNYEELRPVFEEVVLAGDDEYVTLVWNVTGRDPNWKLCGIEVFRVVDGRIAEVWNSTYMDGRWGLSKSLGAHFGGGAGAPVALPLVHADVAVEGQRATGTLLVPAETTGLTHWLTQLLGAPTPDGDAPCARFAPGKPATPLSLTLADTQAPAIGLEGVAVANLSIALERSGLVNAAVALSADVAPARADGPFLPPALHRLADTFGTFERDGLHAAVADAAVTIDSRGAAHGCVTLLFDGADAAAVAGEGVLTFGWRDGDHQLAFTGPARLSSPFNDFAEEARVQASYEWHSDAMSALVTTPRA